MGNEESTMADESLTPETLSGRHLKAVADYIKEGKAKRIVVMTGAGISTAAGIPDFRSPGTGLYANLARLNLPYAEAVFDIDYFQKHPEPFYYLAKELYPGHFHPTVSHAFIALLAKKDLLLMNFTQNIDCLERRAGVPDDRIIEAHGSFAAQRCVKCREPYPDAAMREHVLAEIVPRCEDRACGGLVKPDIVFFGEALPARFRENTHLAAQADLVIVAGTSLSVYPFAGLPEYARGGVPRVLLNRERVGQVGRRGDDVVELGACDDGVRKLAALLGWGEELEALWRGIVGDKEAERQLAAAEKGQEEIQDEVDKLTEEVESALKITAGDYGGDDDYDKETREAKETVEHGSVARMAQVMEGDIARNLEEKRRRGEEAETKTAGDGDAKEEETPRAAVESAPQETPALAAKSDATSPDDTSSREKTPADDSTTESKIATGTSEAEAQLPAEARLPAEAKAGAGQAS
ncbi:hypothetical protein ACHAQA_006785 [Verticillium albo-atrum]